MDKFFAVYILLLGVGTKFSLHLFGKEIQVADLFFVFILFKIIRDSRGEKNSIFLLSIRNLLAILLALLLISTIFSADVAKSLMEFVAMTYLVVLYLSVSSINIDEPRLKSLLNTWLYLSGGLCFLALIGFISYTLFGKSTSLVQYYPDMKSLIPFARVAATFPTMNMFASFLHVSVVFLLAFIIYGHRRRLPYILLGILIGLCLLLTASRNLAGIFVTLFLAILPLRGKLYLPAFKYLLSVFSLLLIFLVIVTTLWSVFPLKVTRDSQNHELSLSVNTAPSLYEILDEVSIGMIKQKFLLGVGPGMFNQKMNDYLDWNNAKPTYETRGFTDKNVSFDPHNTYLGWAAEAGLPFVAVMIGLFCSILWFMWKGYKSCTDSFLGGFCRLCVCGIIGFMLNGFYIDILTMRYFWFMMGLGTLIAVYCLKNRSNGLNN